jgi:hypothetical protein
VRSSGANDIKYVALTAKTAAQGCGIGCAIVEFSDLMAQNSEYGTDPMGYLKKTEKNREYEVRALSDAFEDTPHTRVRLVPAPGEFWVQLRFKKQRVSHGLFLGPTR